MHGYIYIAGSFKTLDPTSVGQVDNDPHFWTAPPTWGICRPDLRAGAQKGSVIFFVLPKASGMPQTVFAYLTISEFVTHAEAYQRPNLREKRMGKKSPNGNVIVNADGKYDQYDAWVHAGNVDRIKERYAIGSETESRMLTETQVRRLAPSFVPTLGRILRSRKTTVFDIVTRKGRRLDEDQVKGLLAWINKSV